MIRSVCLSLFAGLLFSANNCPAQRIAKPDNNALLNVAVLAVQGAQAGDGVFAGYRIPRQFVICDSTGVTAVASREPLPAMAPALATRMTGVESVYVNLYRSRPGNLNDRCVNFNYPIDGRESIAFPFIDSLYSARDPSLAMMTALYHEGFHIFQRQHFAPTRNVPDNIALEEPPPIPIDIIESDTFNALALLERQLLARALQEQATDSIRRLVSEYLDIRKKRLALAPVDRSWSEEHNERKEGTAHYVGYEAARRALGSQTALNELVRSDLQKAPRFANGRGYRNWHIYATGAAICIILDTLKVSWQSAVVDGYTPFQLLQGWSDTPIDTSAKAP